jgi:hypothetical protein
MDFVSFSVTPRSRPDGSDAHYYLELSGSSGAFRVDTGQHRSLLDVEGAFGRPLLTEIREQMRATLLAGKPYSRTMEGAFEPVG